MCDREVSCEGCIPITTPATLSLSVELFGKTQLGQDIAEFSAAIAAEAKTSAVAIEMHQAGRIVNKKTTVDTTSG